MAVGGRGVTSNKRSSSRGISSSVESIGLSLSLSLCFTLANTVVGQTGTISSTTNSSNTDHTGSVSDNVGGVGNTDRGLGADLLGDVLAVLDRGGVNDGGDLFVALLFRDGVALLGGDGVIGGLAVGGSGNPLGNHSRGSGNTDGTTVAKNSSSTSVASCVVRIGISLSKGTATNGKDNHKLLHDCLIG